MKRAHFAHGESTMIVVRSDAKALELYGLTMALLVDHNPYELVISI